MRQNPDLILREIYGKNILMPIRFNEVGALIWKLSDKAKNVTELLNLVCETYNLKIDSAEAVAVEGFIDQLIESKLIMM